MKNIMDVFPRYLKTGRPNKEEEKVYNEKVKLFVEKLIEIDNGVDFKAGVRGWCYILEKYGLPKSDFDKAQLDINKLRRNGDIPNGFFAGDVSRSFVCIEGAADDENVEEYAESIIEDIKYSHLYYKPFSKWEHQKYFIQMLVEKADLVSLFEKLCKQFSIPLTSGKGWSGIGQRKQIIHKFKQYESEGKIPVLLYCGDFDPKGLEISKAMRKNLDDLEGATGWNTQNLIIDRFGLNYDFIKEAELTWIDNLETSSKNKINDLSDPKHRDHHQEYVQTYLKRYGARKCEANALVTAPEMGRKLCLDSILKYLDQDILDNYWEETRAEQFKVRKLIPGLLEESLK